MMKQRFSLAFLTAFGLLTANVLVSCSPKDDSAPSQSGQNTPQPPEGTSDSGGGTGIDGKVFESYIVDPTKLPAYQDHLTVIFSKFKADDSEAAGFPAIFLMKTWYIAPVELDKVGKSTLGISFVKSETQQIARQTMKEVWIDKRIFDQMNTREQAELILHEFVMSLYFMKFMTVSDLCRFSVISKGSGAEDCAQNGALFDKMMPPEEIHPLTDQDNENIRFVTGWLLQNEQETISKSDFHRLLFYKGFDKRFFKPKQEAEQKKEDLKIPAKEFYQSVKGAELSGHMPNVCFAVKNKSNQACRVQLTEEGISLQNMKLPGFRLSLEIDGQKPLQVQIPSGDEVFLGASTDFEGKPSYLYVFSEWRQQIRIGDRVHSGFFLFEKEEGSSQTGLILKSIILKPGIVVSIDKKRQPVCQTREPKVESFLDDALVIMNDDSRPGPTEILYSELKMPAACSETNVTE